MYPLPELARAPLKNWPRADVNAALLHSLEGTIQRIDYHNRELRVVADGHLWRFEVPEDCQLWFEGRQAPLRCFQPLDHTRIYYESQDGKHMAQALYVWEPRPTQTTEAN